MSRDWRTLRLTEAGGLIELRSPGVGIFAPSVAGGELVSPGRLLGRLETLGVGHELRVPEGVAGRIHSMAGGRHARVAVGYGDVLVSLSVADVIGSSARGTSGKPTSATLSFDAPMSGRFYGRPSPEDPPFVGPGETVRHGQTIGLLEVMKTFNRLVYQGDALPETARVVSVVPSDGDDVTRGDPILQLEPGAGG